MRWGYGEAHPAFSPKSWDCDRFQFAQRKQPFNVSLLDANSFGYRNLEDCASRVNLDGCRRKERAPKFEKPDNSFYHPLVLGNMFLAPPVVWWSASFQQVGTAQTRSSFFSAAGLHFPDPLPANRLGNKPDSASAWVPAPGVAPRPVLLPYVLCPY